LTDNHKDTISSINSLGILLGAQGKLREAEPYYREAVEKYRVVLGNNNEETIVAIGNLGFVLSAQGKRDEAEIYFREALETSRRVLGETNRVTLHSTVNLGALLRDQGKLDEAELCLREGWKNARMALGETEPITLRCIGNLGMVMQAQHKYSEVVELLVPALPATRKVFTGSNAWRFARMLLMLGKAQCALRDFPAAAANLHEAHALFDPSRDPSPQDARECTQALVELYAAWHAAEPENGHDSQAAEWQKKLDELD
jgi:tetratricopeptide (TPR) repeat protein